MTSVIAIWRNMPDEAEFSAKFIAVFLKRFYKDIHIFKVF